MRTAFVSSQSVDSEPASSLVSRLRREGWKVFHSPRNPLDGQDSRWSGWYEPGLLDALASAEVFIAVIDEVWSSSSWMAEEAHQAIERKRVSKSYYWNPHGVLVRAKGMVPYLQSRLPDNLDELMDALTAVPG